jgi:type II secretory pathway component PulF
LGQYYYKAVNRAGQHSAGTIEAADRRSAVAGLAERGQFVTELAEEAQAASVGAGKEAGLDPAKPLALGKRLAELKVPIRFGSRRITSRDILAMTSQLSTALRAGLPLLNGLEIIRDQQHKIAMRELLSELAKLVSSGQSLSEAMAGHQEIFSPLYLSMIRVGETGGILEQTSTQLAEILGRDENVKTSMRNASAYPIFVLSLALISVVVILTWILPRILRTISGGIAMLPWPTRMLMAISNVTKAVVTTFYGWLFIAAIIVGLCYFRRWIRSAGRVKWDAFRLRLPILGSVLRTIAVGRFARTLGALTKGGVTILEALGVVRDTLGNELLAREIDGVAEKVKSGASLAGPLEASGYFPPLLVQIVSIGEQTGRLDELLLNAADTFDSEADAAITRFMAIFPAVLILFVALVIGFIIAATLLPIIVMELGGVAL